MINASDSASTRPYLVRALYDWCTDNGLTPYVAVLVNDNVQVPREYVKDGEIVLNISFDATSSLKISNDFIEFKARFAGKAREIMVPMSQVIAIYARENGQGMAFPTLTPADTAASGAQAAPQVVPKSSKPTSAVYEAAHSGTDEKIMQLVAVDQAPEDSVEPPKPSGTRPSLKRIK